MTLNWDCRGKQGCFKDHCLPDWGVFDGCFPRGIKPSDVDGVVHVAEAGGLDRFLFFEKKPAGKSLSTGQQRLLAALGRLPGCTVLALRGEAPSGIDEMLWFPGPQGWRPSSVDSARLFCEAWSAGADGDWTGRDDKGAA